LHLAYQKRKQINYQENTIKNQKNHEPYKPTVCRSMFLE
jgi:hypothetical protein